ncbi:MAG: hypothetical protein ACOZNI_12620 [Myxococcota bacterium]
MIWFLLAACSNEPATPPAPAEAPPPAAPTAPAPAADHATPHAHAAPHGGEVKSVASVHLEAKFMPEGLLVWVTDKDEKALDTAAYAGATAVLKGDGAPQTVTFTPMGEHLHAQATLTHGAPASAVVTITVDGKPQSVQFSTPAVGMAEHEHTSVHGGVVSMWGDYHVEYAPKDGEYRFYMTDAKRQSVTTDVTGSVKDGDKTIPLELDAATGMLHGKGEGAGTRPVMLEAKVGDKAFSLGFDAAGGSGHHTEGSAHGDAAEGGGHDHGAHGH